MRSSILAALLVCLPASRAAEPPRRIALVMDRTDRGERTLFLDLVRDYRARERVLSYELADFHRSDPIAKGKLLSSLQACDLVVAVGDGATEFAVAELEDVPVYFVDATVVRGRGLQGASVSGVFGYSVDDLLDAVKTLRLGPVGVAFTPGYEPVAEWIRAGAAARGMASLSRRIAAPRELAPAVRTLLGRAKVLWLVGDPLLVDGAGFEFIQENSLDANIPLVGPGRRIVSAGALLGSTPDPAGQESAALKGIDSILRGTAAGGPRLTAAARGGVILINGAFGREVAAAGAGRLAEGAMNLHRTGLFAKLDKGLSSFLRFDLSRTDVVKWVLFARQLLLLLLMSVISIAGLSAVLSTMQARSLLERSLDREGRAVADAAARAAFVPLTLEDDAALRELAASYRNLEDLGSLRVLDAGGAVRASLPAASGSRLDFVRVPVARHGAPPVGSVEVGMRREKIDRRIRTIAATNLAIAAGLAVLVWVVGVMVIGNLIDRTRELVGEARLAEEVQRANAELEAFSYSVAHDLRAPLRAIDGFSQALLDGYSDKVDEQGRHYLSRLRENTRRMGQLINDLLGLSRVTRGELKRVDFDLAAHARGVAARLRRGQPERDVEFVIPNTLPVNGDPNLLLAAVENLLGNAWKYTSRKPRARIELGRERRDRETVYFVRDDGAGFDMAFANKLFKPFSRLHSPGEFEGTGIGLATVDRIVSRHGGRIWGEGKVGEGATFYFTTGEPR